MSDYKKRMIQQPEKAMERKEHVMQACLLYLENGVPKRNQTTMSVWCVEKSRDWREYPENTDRPSRDYLI